MDSSNLDVSVLLYRFQYAVKLHLPSYTIDIAALILFLVIACVGLLKGVVWDKPDPHLYIYFERPQQQDSGKNVRSVATRNIAQILEESDIRVVVFWGSQSGTAERFASQLAKELQVRFRLPAIAADLSDYDPESIGQLPRTRLAVFILSTYGEGDPSDNASGLWEWIQRPGKLSLPDLQYAAFGLGNSNYKHYNRVVDVVVKALSQGGASSALPVAKADDAQCSTEEDFISWKDDLFAVLQREMDLVEHTTEYAPTTSVVEDDSMVQYHGEPAHPKIPGKATSALSEIKALSVKSQRELFSVSDRNCLHMELDLADQPELHYKTGDHLGVSPSNPDSEVERLISALGMLERADMPICLKTLDTSVKLKVPSPTTPGTLFRYYLEICAPTSRDTIAGLSQFAPSPAAKDFVTKLGRSKEFYADFITRNHLTLGRLLALASPTAPWAQLPLSYVIETLPALRPRYYSISSSSIVSPRRLAITAAVSVDTLPNASDQRIHGLTTNYLLALSSAMNNSNPQPDKVTYDLQGPNSSLNGSKLFAHIRKSKFKLPTMSSCPIIMVAAGTGLAPFRAFISERLKLHTIGKPVGEMTLFFGCRHPDQDFIYKDELSEMQKGLGGSNGKLKIITAFSRHNEGRPKIYVQDRVREAGAEILDLLDAGASFYVCGRASMAREVGKAVADTVCTVKGYSGEDARDWSEGLRRKRKWHEDVWG